MKVELEAARVLQFDDGTPVRAASALARLGRGWLVAQDDATHGAWVVSGSVTRLRLLPPVEGLDVFSEADGTKHLKPDLEAACSVVGEGGTGVLLLGSGTTAARRRGVLVTERGSDPQVEVGELGPLYDAVARALGVAEGQLDLEGVARNGPVLRWFQRGNRRAGVPNSSVDVGLPALLEALRGQRDPADVPVREPRQYALGEVRGAALGATDAVALPGGRVLLSAAAEDTPDAYDDGPVAASALVLLEGDRVLDTVEIPLVEGVVPKVEGLGIVELTDEGAVLLAVVDADDPEAPSLELALRVVWG